MTALVLLKPKFENNVAMVVRLAAAFGIPTVVCIRPRYQSEERVPRELRMFRDKVKLEKARDLDFAAPHRQMFVAVERRDNAESLIDFVHPKPGVGYELSYVFGPEDGDIDQGTMRRCQRFVQIPVNNSLNLATAVAMVLWDRKLKESK